MILNAFHIFVTKQYQTANLDYKEYEQAILTHIMLHLHHHVHKHNVSRHVGILFPSYIQDYYIQTSSLLRNDARCGVVGRYRRCWTTYQLHLQGSRGTHFE